MPHTNPIPLTEENLPALQKKHAEKIDISVGNDSVKQQERLRLFEHDPVAMANHYPELQAKSEELRKRSLVIDKISALVGWLALAATATFTGFKAMKKKISPSNLIQGVVVVLTSITAGLVGNFITQKVLGASIRQEAKDVATASRVAYEREVAPYMEDTEHKLALRAQAEAQKAKNDAGVTPRDPSFAAQVVNQPTPDEIAKAPAPVMTPIGDATAKIAAERAANNDQVKLTA